MLSAAEQPGRRRRGGYWNRITFHVYLAKSIRYYFIFCLDTNACSRFCWWCARGNIHSARGIASTSEQNQFEALCETTNNAHKRNNIIAGERTNKKKKKNEICLNSTKWTYFIHIFSVHCCCCFPFDWRTRIQTHTHTRSRSTDKITHNAHNEAQIHCLPFAEIHIRNHIHR